MKGLRFYNEPTHVKRELPLHMCRMNIMDGISFPTTGKIYHPVVSFLQPKMYGHRKNNFFNSCLIFRSKSCEM